jgi:hypothetical protein
VKPPIPTHTSGNKKDRKGVAHVAGGEVANNTTPAHTARLRHTGHALR